MTSPPVGQPTQALDNYLGSGGFHPRYQIGSPRSIRVLKLLF